MLDLRRDEDFFRRADAGASSAQSDRASGFASHHGKYGFTSQTGVPSTASTPTRSIPGFTSNNSTSDNPSPFDREGDRDANNSHALISAEPRRPHRCGAVPRRVHVTSVIRHTCENSFSCAT